jgi:hypothetical protein
MYLSTDATFGTLRAVAALAPGTEIIFEYSVLKELVDEETQKMLAVVQTAAQAVPEDNKLRRDEIVLSRMLTSSLSERAVEGILRRKSEIDRFSARVSRRRGPSSDSVRATYASCEALREELPVLCSIPCMILNRL